MHSSRDMDTGEYIAVVNAEADAPSGLFDPVRVDISALSHQGKVRQVNEDHFLTARFGRSFMALQSNVPGELAPDRFAETGYALVVADGVGGAAAGEVASSLAISIGLNLSLNSPKWILRMTREEIQEAIATWERRFRQIDHILTRRAEADPALTGMSTTLTIVCSVGTDLLLYHIGDSRCYLLRRGRLHQLTRDHTVAQELADAGQIDPKNVRTHRLRHTLTRALGSSGGAVEVEVGYVRLENGDSVLLCTDGLTEMVPDDRIAAALARGASAEETCQALLQLALDGGGRDNITIAVARYSIAGEPSQGQRQ